MEQDSPPVKPPPEKRRRSPVEEPLPEKPPVKPPPDSEEPPIREPEDAGLSAAGTRAASAPGFRRAAR